MKIFFTSIIFFLFNSVFSQQFNFNQLVEMTNDNKVFEIKMLKALNRTFEKDKTIFYSYKTINGIIGASDNMPTNNSKYEKIFKFEDGQNYTESEIENRNLDPNFLITNRLVKEGQPINKFDINGFRYVPYKIVSLFKTELIKSGFAEKYNSEEKTADTWYSWESLNYIKILKQSKPHSPGYKKLKIELSRENDFSSLLNQIISVSKYIETKEEYGEFISYYKFGVYSITSKRTEDDYNGGIITINVDKI